MKERMWKETAVAKFKALNLYLPRGSTENLSKERWLSVPTRDLM
jgi:hypothetical protein